MVAPHIFFTTGTRRQRESKTLSRINKSKNTQPREMRVEDALFDSDEYSIFCFSPWLSASVVDLKFYSYSKVAAL
jgi:hypothetical protein